MKKYLMAAVALICMTITCVAFAACSTDEDESKTLIFYSAEGNIGYVGSDTSESFQSAFAIANFNTAIKNVTGDYSTTSKDKEVIAACDKLYESQRANHPAWKGSVQILKYMGTSDKTGTVIKTYQYN